MKYSIKKLITAATLALILMLTLAACGGKSEEKPYDFLVTFNYNVGNLEANCPDQYLGVMEGGKVAIKPGYNESFKEQEVLGYYLEGWYLPKLDESGNPVVGEDNRVVLDTRWDFATGTVSADMTLYANLVRRPSLIITGGDEDVVFTGKPDDVRSEPSSYWQPKKEGWTFYGYYADEDYQTPFGWPYVFGTEDKTVYAKFIEGEWAIVKDAAGFKAAASASQNVYIDADIDFSKTAWSVIYNFAGKIEGNGHSLTGIKATFTANKTTRNFGLFASVKSTAVIRNVKFVGVEAVFNASINTSVPYQAALFAHTIENGAAITDVTVTGTIRKGSVASGIPYELFGFCSQTDLSGVDLTGTDYSGIEVIEE